MLFRKRRRDHHFLQRHVELDCGSGVPETDLPPLGTCRQPKPVRTLPGPIGPSHFHLQDIYIGWKFAGLVYLVNNGDNSHAGVDLDPSLIHDIVPALGESHEALGSRGIGFAAQNSEVNEDR